MGDIVYNTAQVQEDFLQTVLLQEEMSCGEICVNGNNFFVSVSRIMPRRVLKISSDILNEMDSTVKDSIAESTIENVRKTSVDRVIFCLISKDKTRCGISGGESATHFPPDSENDTREGWKASNGGKSISGISRTEQ